MDCQRYLCYKIHVSFSLLSFLKISLMLYSMCNYIHSCNCINYANHFFLVCVKFMTRFIDELPSDMKSDHEKIENHMRKFCAKTKKDDNRFVSSMSISAYAT